MEQLKDQKTVLIVDDSKLNRTNIIRTIGGDYNIIEADNGVEALQIIRHMPSRISLILLDFLMPKMNGFELLAAMKEGGFNEVPVIMVSSETHADFVQRAYDLGVVDFISMPFNPEIVRHRISNTLELVERQKSLVSMVVDQMYERQHEMSSMVTILSHIVEFRNGESGPHVQHVRTITEMLLIEYINRCPECGLTGEDVIQIGMASSLHDIGKITILDEILNKPGRLTAEEFEIMKTHSAAGAKMLYDLPELKNESMVQHAYDICRWHHERFDGSGYPDGLVGNAIPLSAQAVSIADVYDALTSERVYKPAYTHEEACRMIRDGECGAMNPDLIECFEVIAPELPAVLANPTGPSGVPLLEKNIITQMIADSEGAATGTQGVSRKLLNYERTKHQFLASMTNEIQYEYSVDPPLVVITEYGAQKLGLPQIIRDPHHNDLMLDFLGADGMGSFLTALSQTTCDNPETTFELLANIDDTPRWFRVHARTMWSVDDGTVRVGSIGKALDVTQEHRQMADLKYKASYDSLTHTLNHANARRLITERLTCNPNQNYVIVMADLDNFKEANDERGHLFGDKLLKHFSGILCSNVRSRDIVARFGGDEFLLCIEANADFTPIITRIFKALQTDFEGYSLRASMGVSCTNCCGRDYDTLLTYADEALYSAKRSGRASLSFCRKSKCLAYIHRAENGLSQLTGIHLAV